MATKKVAVVKTQNSAPVKAEASPHKKTIFQPHNPRLTDPGVRKIGHNMKAQVPRYRKAG